MRNTLTLSCLVLSLGAQAQWATNGTNINSTNTGNVGIGTATPAAKLDVVGNLNISEGNQITIGGTRLLAANGTQNLFLGSASGLAITTGQRNTFFGFQSGPVVNTGSNNAFIGYRTGYVNTTGSDNIFIGSHTGYTNNTGSFNAYLGTNAGYSNASGDYGLMLGYFAGYSNTSGTHNAYIGYQAGYTNKIGNYNIAIGSKAGYTATGSYNAFIGYHAGRENTTGENNAYIGFRAGHLSTTGGNNTFIGNSAGDSNISGSQNTYIGSNAKGTDVLTNATAIGANANVTTSNSLVLGNGANVGVDVSAPTSKLDVNGQVRIRGGAPGAGKVLTSDANGLATWQTPGSNGGGGTLDQAYDQGGAGAGRTITADAGAVKIAGADGILVTGTPGSGAKIDAIGAGSFMYFNPRKAAFRAGRVVIDEWNDANVGQESVVIGHGTATDSLTVAIGHGNRVNAPLSNAFGFGNTTLGRYSNAVGTSVGAYSFGEVATGFANTSYTPQSTVKWVATDRLFVIGNGTEFRNGSDALRMLKNGNTAIGNMDPTSKLDVDGQIRIRGGAPGAGKVLTSDANGLATWATPTGGGLPNGAAAGNTPYWNGTAWVTNSSNIFNNGGNVGIGTTSPTTAKLVIGGTSQSDGLDLSSANVYANMRVLRNSNSSVDKDMFIGYNSGTLSALHLFSDNTETMTLTGTNVGIGTNSPSTAKLVIGGTSGETGLDLSSSDVYADLRVLRNSLNASDQDMYIGYESGYNSALHLYSNNNEMVTVKGANVGINNAAPQKTLDVTGSVHVTESYYDSNNDKGTAGQVLTSTASGTDWVTLTTGAQGPAGPQGPVGPAGPQGPAGSGGAALPVGTNTGNLMMYDKSGNNWVAKTISVSSMGSNQPVDNMQPYLVLNYCIAVQGIFPMRDGQDPFVGEIMLFAGNFAPTGWAMCNGQLLNVKDNTPLYSILGNLYGGSDQTTFGLPDLRGRVAMSSGTGTGLSARNLGDKGGRESVVLSVGQMPAHSHQVLFTAP